MPKDTFLNLNEAKRNKIIDNIVQAYSENDFHDITVTKLITYCDIPRGSFYQYFEDLEDVIVHVFTILFEYIFEKKIEILSSSEDLFSYFNNVLEFELKSMAKGKYKNFIHKTIRYINPYLKYRMFSQKNNELIDLIIKKRFDCIINQDKEVVEQLFMINSTYKYGYLFTNVHLNNISRDECMKKYQNFLELLKNGIGE